MMKLIGQVLLTSDAATVTFSNIDQSGYSLILKTSTGAVTGDDAIQVLVNGDTNTSNYENLAQFSYSFTGAMGHGPIGDSPDMGYSARFDTTPLNLSNNTTTIVDYSSAKSKTLLSDAWDILNQLTENSGTHTSSKYTPNSAVTSLTIRHRSGGQFKSQSIFSLYMLTS